MKSARVQPVEGMGVAPPFRSEVGGGVKSAVTNPKFDGVRSELRAPTTKGSLPRGARWASETAVVSISALNFAWRALGSVSTSCSVRATTWMPSATAELSISPGFKPPVVTWVGAGRSKEVQPVGKVGGKTTKPWLISVWPLKALIGKDSRFDMGPRVA